MHAARKSHFLDPAYLRQVHRMRYPPRAVSAPKPRPSSIPIGKALLLATAAAAAILLSVNFLSGNRKARATDSAAELPHFNTMRFDGSGERPFDAIQLQGRPTAILFWSPEHDESQEAMRWFAVFQDRLAKETRPHRFVVFLTTEDRESAWEQARSLGGRNLILLHHRKTEDGASPLPALFAKCDPGQYFLFDQFGQLIEEGTSPSELGIALEEFRLLAEI